MNTPLKYNPSELEKHWYNYWMEHKFFASKPDTRIPYTIVIPPPNVTGVLHMGHMLNNTIQDVLIRRARHLGFNACWVPGTDHASIATEAKVVAKLKEQGISKNDLTREEFIAHAWEWKNEYGGVILEQLKKLGCSCDWDRTAFTMDTKLSDSVIKVFVDLFNKGLIYRGNRMVNWDPEALTTLSDEEVIYEERQGLLYYISYDIVGSTERLTIATTRPETIFGDTAICIHPEDHRYLSLHGKKAIVPLSGREIPIINDTYVDMEFGTGCLKVTPAHDLNDKAIGETHGLDIIDIFNPDATLNAYGLAFEGMDRFKARKAVGKALEKEGFLVKTEPHINKVGTSERTKAVIEPRLSDQWFLKMELLAQPALKAVLVDEEIKLFPKKFENTYRHWMENVRDWNISRQLWWGQQIPAFYYGNGREDFVVAENVTIALKLAQEKSVNSHLSLEDLRQDEDALDTWFSSWLWPISVFNGILEPENDEINYYYPTNDLVTGPDILFFWVARMIVAGYEFRDAKPFTNVYFTGLVRDKQRRKMSKSLGNSPNALKLIEDYGADGVRVGLLLSSAAGNDLMFDEALCQQGKNFANKIWNGFKLIQSWETVQIEQPEAAKKGIEWYSATFDKALLEIEDHFSKYRISDALMAIYKLIWDDYSSWLLELVKPAYQKPVDKATKDQVIVLLENNLKILHPFMPFLTEDIWQQITDRKPQEALIIAPWPKGSERIDNALLLAFETAKQVVSGVRTIRKEKQIANKEVLDLVVLSDQKPLEALNSVIEKLSNLTNITQTETPVEGALSFRVDSLEYFVPISGAIDIEAEATKVQEELNYTQGFLKSVEDKLSNERFVSNAPKDVIAIEKKKQIDAKAKIETLIQSLVYLRS